MQSETNSSDWRTVLKHEFAAGEGSFLLQLRCGHWDKDAHRRLFVAMHECCKAHEGETRIERWIAEGFWWLDSYSMNGYANSENESLSNAAVNFNHLAHWLFTGAGHAEDEFEPMNFD